jgi:hypothetical protein
LCPCRIPGMQRWQLIAEAREGGLAGSSLSITHLQGATWRPFFMPTHLARRTRQLTHAQRRAGRAGDHGCSAGCALTRTVGANVPCGKSQRLLEGRYISGDWWRLFGLRQLRTSTEHALKKTLTLQPPDCIACRAGQQPRPGRRPRASRPISGFQLRLPLFHLRNAMFAFRGLFSVSSSSYVPTNDSACCWSAEAHRKKRRKNDEICRYRLRHFCAPPRCLAGFP